MRTIIARLLIVTLIASLAGNSARAAQPTARQMINDLISKNEASRAKIRSIEFDFGIDRQTGGHFIYDGPNRANTYHSSMFKDARCVINDRYIALWERSEYVRIYLRAPGKPPSEMTTDLINVMAGHDPLLWGFGLGFGELRGAIYFDQLTYRVEEVRNEKNERIVRVKWVAMSPIGPAREIDRAIYEFNADRGFLLTHTAGFTEIGDLQQTTDVTAEQIDGVWMPVHVTSVQFKSKVGKAPQQPLKTTEREFINIHVNKRIDPAKFETENMGIPAGTLIEKTDLGGKITTLSMPTTGPVDLD